MANNANTPTMKQRLFAREYIRRKGNGRQAALAVYDVKPSSAHNLANDNLKKPIVQQEIKKLLEKSELGLDNVSDKISDAITKGLDSGKATVDTALRGLDMVLKLHNAYPATRSIKLAYTHTEQVASKDLQAVVEDLKTITARANSLLSSTE